MNKKAQGLSLNTIIVAIIVLIVLVVIIMLFTGYFGSKFTPGVTSCTAQGGECVATGNCQGIFGGAGKTLRGSFSDCSEAIPVCCIQALSGQGGVFGTDAQAQVNLPPAGCLSDNDCDVAAGQTCSSSGQCVGTSQGGGNLPFIPTVGCGDVGGHCVVASGNCPAGETRVDNSCPGSSTGGPTDICCKA